MGAFNAPYDPGDTGPIPLGFDKNGNFVVRDQERDLILSATSSQTLKPSMAAGTGAHGFLGRTIPHRKRDIPSILAGSALIEGCRSKGPFDPATLSAVAVCGRKMIALSPTLEMTCLMISNAITCAFLLFLSNSVRNSKRHVFRK